MKLSKYIYFFLAILCVYSVNSQDVPPTTDTPTETVTTTTQSPTSPTPTPTASPTPTVTTSTTEISCSSNSELAPGGYDCATCANKTALCSYKEEEKCYCAQGYVRDNKNNCILSSNCNDQNTCDENETPALNGIDCLTCSNYGFQRCPLEMKRSCYCKGGYVRISDSNRTCVLVEDCPKEIEDGNNANAGNCPPNSVYMTTNVNCKKCGLDNLNCSQYPPGCYCKTGFVYYNGQCVLPYQCPVSVNQACARRSTWCRGCYSTCTRRYSVFGYRAGRCALKCPRCMCPPGLVGDELGNCQPEENCRPSSYVLRTYQ